MPTTDTRDALAAAITDHARNTHIFGKVDALELADAIIASPAIDVALRSPDSSRSPKIRRFLPAHAYLAVLLAETRGATHTRLERLWAVKSARSDDSAWPFISGSGLRTRVSELVRWGIVEWSGAYGHTIANRPSKIWQLTNLAMRSVSIENGTAVDVPGFDPDAPAALRQLHSHETDLVIRVTLESVATAAGIRL